MDPGPSRGNAPGFHQGVFPSPVTAMPASYPQLTRAPSSGHPTQHGAFPHQPPPIPYPAPQVAGPTSHPYSISSAQTLARGLGDLHDTTLARLDKFEADIKATIADNLSESNAYLQRQLQDHYNASTAATSSHVAESSAQIQRVLQEGLKVFHETSYGILEHVVKRVTDHTQSVAASQQPVLQAYVNQMQTFENSFSGRLGRVEHVLNILVPAIASNSKPQATRYEVGINTDPLPPPKDTREMGIGTTASQCAEVGICTDRPSSNEASVQAELQPEPHTPDRLDIGVDATISESERTEGHRLKYEEVGVQSHRAQSEEENHRRTPERSYSQESSQFGMDKLMARFAKSPFCKPMHPAEWSPSDVESKDDESDGASVPSPAASRTTRGSIEEVEKDVALSSATRHSSTTESHSASVETNDTLVEDRPRQSTPENPDQGDKPCDSASLSFETKNPIEQSPQGPNSRVPSPLNADADLFNTFFQDSLLDTLPSTAEVSQLLTQTISHGATSPRPRSATPASVPLVAPYATPANDDLINMVPSDPSSSQLSAPMSSAFNVPPLPPASPAKRRRSPVSPSPRLSSPLSYDTFLFSPQRHQPDESVFDTSPAQASSSRLPIDTGSPLTSMSSSRPTTPPRTGNSLLPSPLDGISGGRTVSSTQSTVAAKSARVRLSSEGGPRKKRRKTEGAIPESRGTSKKSLVHGASSKSKGKQKQSRKTLDPAALMQAQESTMVVQFKWPPRIEGTEADQRKFVQCDNCRAWFHLTCVGLVDGDPILELDEKFFCPPCMTSQEEWNRRSMITYHEDMCARPDCDCTLRLSDENEYFVERIIGRNLYDLENNRSVQHTDFTSFLWLIKWEGWGVNDATWTLPWDLGDGEKYVQGFVDAAAQEGLDISDPKVKVVLAEAAAAGW